MAPAFSTTTKTFEGSTYAPGADVSHFPESVIEMGVACGGIVVQDEAPTFGDEDPSERPEQTASGETLVDPVLDEPSEPEPAQEQPVAVEDEAPATDSVAAAQG